MVKLVDRLLLGSNERCGPIWRIIVSTLPVARQAVILPGHSLSYAGTCEFKGSGKKNLFMINRSILQVRYYG